MANLKYRGNSTTPTKPTSTTAKAAPLTNEEIDGNLRSLNDSKLEVGGWSAGDIFYADASGNLVRMPIGPTGSLLTPLSGYPAWVSAADLANNVNIQEFSTAGTSTWVKPTGAKTIHVILYSGGSSGVAGTAYSSISSTKAYPGGTGGFAGSRTEFYLDASTVGDTVTVICGAGGAATSSNFITNPGSTSRFGTYYAVGGQTQYLGIFESGVSAGSTYFGGTIGSVILTSLYGYVSTTDGNMYYTTPTGKGGSWTSSNSGGNIIMTANAGQIGGLGAGGGGCGGGINSNSTWNPGAAGGAGGGALILSSYSVGTSGTYGYGSSGGSTSGQSGSSTVASWKDGYYGGNGGGGGASSVTGNGGAGGAGNYGAGGGGGGSCLSGFTPGQGGAGGTGYVRVITYK